MKINIFGLSFDRCQKSYVHVNLFRLSLQAQLKEVLYVSFLLPCRSSKYMQIIYKSASYPVMPLDINTCIYLFFYSSETLSSDSQYSMNHIEYIMYRIVQKYIYSRTEKYVQRQMLYYILLQLMYSRLPSEEWCSADWDTNIAKHATWININTWPLNE